MITLTADLLVAATACSPTAAAAFAQPLALACATYAINTPQRVAAFLAQIGHESGSLKHVSEIWGPTPAQQRYEGRADLGNVFPGDGSRYRGRGLIQTTGRYNYARVRDRLRARFEDVPDFEQDPEALTAPRWAALSAADYWDDKKLSALADAGDFETITRRINGGLNGYEDRKARWERALKALVPTVTATPKEQSMPLPAFVAAALPSIIAAIPQLGKLFGSGSDVAERNIKAAELAVQIVQNAVGAKNAQDAVETIKADPAALQTASQAITEQWWQLTESGGGGIEGARRADAVVQSTGFWKSPAFWITVSLLPLVYGAAYAVLFLTGFSNDMKAMVLGAIFGGLLTGGIQSFWFGTSASSQRKTDIMSHTKE
jgi:putative chitinase